MDFLETLIERNARFAETVFAPDLKMLPSTSTIILGCVDPRVDPADVLGLKPGEAAVIRNVGGRLNPSLIETLAILRIVAKSAGQGTGLRNLVLLHHTDCGIVGCYHHAPDLLARHLGVEVDALDGYAITDPHKAILHDVDTLKANDQFPDNLVVTGLVYDVKTGRIETVVPASPLRPLTA
jgi:carbonic anhydrase